MVFPSIEFAVFFPVVLGISWLLMPRPAIHKPFLIFVSYVFYAAANPKFCLLLGGVTLGNQLFEVLAVLLDTWDAATSETRKKFLTTAHVHDQIMVIATGKVAA